MSDKPDQFSDVDESKVAGENGDMYLFQWLSSIEKSLKAATPEDIKANQSQLESSLVKIITGVPSFPPPGRPLRNLVARCLVLVYTYGETRTLFETLQAFLKAVGDHKVLDKDANKTAAIYCVGELMASFGSQVMSFMLEIATITLKVTKSSNSVLLRYHAVTALRKSLTTARRACTESTIKDIYKQMRYALSDKSLAVQRVAADVLIVMYSSGDNDLKSSSDIDTIVTLCVKGLDNADQLTRRSLSRLVAQVLTTAKKDPPPSAQDTKKSSSKNDQDAITEDISTGPKADQETVKSILTPNEMLTTLSNHLNKPNASRKLRIGIFDFYTTLFTHLGPSFVEDNYPLILSHFCNDIIANPRNAQNRYEILLVRSLVEILVRDLIGVRMLSEQAQIGALQELASAYLRRWPAVMPGQVAPDALVLVVVLREVAGLLKQLGNVPTPIQDALVDPLLTLLTHPSHTVRINAAWTLKQFCFSTPLQLPKMLLTVIDALQKDITTLSSPVAPSDIRARALGHAYALAGLVSIIPKRPLYVSYDISTRVLDTAIQLLKRAGEMDLGKAVVDVEVAWTIIASLTTLGPNFVRSQLPQLLVLWRNALPKPTSKDNMNRSVGEWSFLLHVRESALGAMLCFLQHNSPTLVTLDVARRITSLLTNALQFANSFLGLNVDETTESMESVSAGLNLRGRESLLRRRVFQCFSALGFSGVPESTQMSLLQSAVSLFASPDGYAGSSVQAAIASSSGNFTSIWSTGDEYAYGVSSIDVACGGDDGGQEGLAQEERDRLNRDAIETAIESLFRTPVIGSCEHDPLTVCHSHDTSVDRQTPPVHTAVVNAAIDLFAELLCLQDLISTTKIITQLVDSVRSSKLEKNVGRKSAVTVNATLALTLALRQASMTQNRRAREVIGQPDVSSVISSFLKDGLVEGDLVLRTASSEAIGRLASMAGTNFLTSQVKALVDQVVNNRDPHGRAGCAMAFGAIHSHVGGLAAGPLLKTTVNVLMSLINDPHPVVHFWSLDALSQVITAASLAYGPFVTSTLVMLFKVYMLDSHEQEGGTIGSSNLSGDLPAYLVGCRVIDAVITVLGPDMQEQEHTRNLILDLVFEFSLEPDEGISVEAIKCIQHLLMFASEHIQISELVTRLRCHLNSPRRPLKLAAINALYQLVQRDAIAISKLGGDSLVQQLFGMLDDDASIDGVRNVISSWLQQTVVHNPSAWIDLCQRIMSRTTASQQVTESASKTGGLHDDEGESLSIGLGTDDATQKRIHATSRWRTQLFALQCLHVTCTVVAQSGRREHFDIPFARKQGLHISALLVSRISDLIKMAFTASAAYVTEIRLEGLVVLRDVIKLFAKSPDPDYEDTLLLEQHQAPITAALTPAFSSESTPDVLASAIGTCAIFVGCGVVKDVARMGRILKLLISALEQSKETGTLSLGDAGPVGPNASVMLRIATLSAWAELEVASSRQDYLKEVLKPYRATLAPLWVGSLRDYASIRAESEVMQDTTSSALESSYSSLGKEVLLPFYIEAWPVILHAVATAMTAGDPYILAAMDGQQPDAAAKTNGVAVREEPTALFYAVFGLVFEDLSTSAVTSSTSSSRSPAITLQALKSLVKPQYSGRALLQPAIFQELTSMFYRLAMTEPAFVQIHLLETLTSLATTQATPIPAMSTIDAFPADVPQTQCLRICAYILRNLLPGAAGRAGLVDAGPADKINLIKTGFDSLAAIGATFGPSCQEEVRTVGISLYSELLRDESSSIDYVGPTLHCLKTLLDRPNGSPDPQEKYARAIHGILSACLVNIDNMRGRQGLISMKIIKSNLLAAVLVLTSVPPSVKVAQLVVERCCFIITDNLVTRGETSVTAAHCAKTLIVASVSGNVLLRHCTKLLLPGLIEYITKIASLDEQAIADAHLTAVGEVWKAFSALFNSLPDEQRVLVLGVLLPTILLLLDPSCSPPTALHTQGVTQLLSYAASSPSAFKDAQAKLEGKGKEVLQDSVRAALASQTGEKEREVAKPQISLRSF